MFDWIFRKPSLKRFEDSIALTRDSLIAGLRTAIDNRRQSEHVILLVAHFPETFDQLQNHLEQWELEHEIVTQPITLQWFDSVATDAVSPIFLTLGEMLLLDEPAPHRRVEDLTVAMMVFERHPYAFKDERLERFAKQLPMPVELGYFIALDDAVLSTIMSDQLLKLLSQLGMTKQSLITSDLISKNLHRSLRRTAKLVNSDHPADSAAEWIELNISKSDDD